MGLVQVCHRNNTNGPAAHAVSSGKTFMVTHSTVLLHDVFMIYQFSTYLL